jgi:hypothetical protein
MLIPAAMQIYEGIELLKSIPTEARSAQMKEFFEACPSASSEQSYGYGLGLATARAILLTSSTLILAGVKPEDVL